jgi:hypothetical protein
MEEHFTKKKGDDEEYFSKSLEDLRTKDAND